MAYIGRPLNAGNLAVQSGTGDGSDTTPIATLDYSVGSSNSIGVYLDGVRQLAGTDFTASGTTLTFTTAPANGVGVDVYFLGLELSIPTPADGTVATAKIADDAVTLAKMAPGTDGNLITYDASGNPAAVATGSSGQVLTSAGAGAPPTFSAAPSHTGNVAFPATQSASADANTLDDYEEGTWTASLTDGTNAASPTVTGSYTKIGDLVYATAFLGLSSLGSASGGASIAGLPFTSKNDGRYSSITVGYTHHFDSMTAGHNILGHLPANSALISLYVADIAIGASGMTTAEFSANGQLLFSIMYKAA